MTGSLWEQDYLDALMTKYVKQRPGWYQLRCVWGGYVSRYSVSGRMAQCSYSIDPDTKTMYAVITMSEAFSGAKLFTQRSALYHEFCHAEAWYEENAKGHDNAWIIRWLRRPILSIGGVFTSIFWYILNEVKR